MDKKLLCPFNNQECSDECALFVQPDEFNELVKNKLASVGVISRTKGFCSFKNIAMVMDRQIFEKLSSFSR